MTTVICDRCHKECVPSGCGIGYGVMKHKAGNETRLCYECCAKWDVEYMLDNGSHYLYIDREKREVSNWPGTLRLAAHIRTGRHNWYMCKRYDAWFHVPGDPYVWHGVNISGGFNDVIHCKRTKSTEY